MFAILRNGKLVKHVVFVGLDLYRDHKVEVVTFKTEDEAKELLLIWDDAKIVSYDNSIEQLAA